MTSSATPPSVRLRRAVPALWRSAGVLQIGIDPQDALVLDGVPDALAGAVALLAEPRSRSELVRLLPDLSPGWIDWLLDRLGTAGLLWTGSATRSSVTVIGSGDLAEAVGEALSRSGLEGPSRLGNWPEGAVPGRRGQPALVHWSRAGAPWPDITVVATDTAEPDRTLTDVLLRDNRAHLVVRLESAAAVVGPLVVPGRSPCIRCSDLGRCRLDPLWPRLLAQLCRERTCPNAALRDWAASMATAQVRALIAGSLPDTVGRSLEMSSEEYLLRARPVPADPACGCLAALEVEPLGTLVA